MNRRPSDSLAATLGPVTRTSVTGEPRGPLCGMGVCHECRVTSDGRAHVRSCMVPKSNDTGTNQPDPRKAPSDPRPEVLDFKVVIVGAGPAGLGAAGWFANRGVESVVLIDENRAAGGQIWRAPNKQAEDKLSQILKGGLKILTGAAVVDSPGKGVLLLDRGGTPLIVTAEKVILATGSRELFLPFPGWTLPNVMGAGGLQAMVKSGLPIKGKRVVVSGTGPLLLEVAAYLSKKGAKVVRIAEQADFARVVSFGAHVAKGPGRWGQMIRLVWKTTLKTRYGSWIERAAGAGKLESVTVVQRCKRRLIPCDYLACGFGLIPNVELPLLLGCELRDGFVKVDSQFRSSVDGVYCVGELTGIAGWDQARLEGICAAASAFGEPTNAATGNAASECEFPDKLAKTYCLRPEVLQLANDSTIICRCEDVSLGQLSGFTNARDAKLQTRCGMGPCQGRICGAIVREMLGWEQDSVRPPVVPIAAGSLASIEQS